MFCSNDMSLLMRHQKVFMWKEGKKFGYRNPTQIFIQNPELWDSLSEIFDLLYRRGYLG